MRLVVRVPDGQWQALRGWLLTSDDERLAYLLARASVWRDPWQVDTADLLVRRVVPVPDAALAAQSPVRVEVRPAFCRALLRACYEGGLSLIDVHSHPFAGGRVAFSGHDLANMRMTHAQFHAQIPQDPPALAASLVLGQAGVAGGWLDASSGEVRPIDDLQLVGDRFERVATCRR